MNNLAMMREKWQEMTFDDVCLLFDECSVVEKQVQVDAEYLAASDIIYSDGVVHQNINKEGCIHITSIEGNPTYVMFLNPSGNIFICIYKYMQIQKFTEIVSNVDTLREKTGVKHISQRHHEKKQHGEEQKKSEDIKPIEDDAPKPINTHELKSQLVDINKFKCTQCGGTVKLSKERDGDTIIAKCLACKTEFYMVPSKYYVISAKKIVYSKGADSKTVKIN